LNDKNLRSIFFALITLLGITDTVIPVEAANTISPDNAQYTILPDQVTYTVVPGNTTYTIAYEKTTYTIVPAKDDNTATPIKRVAPVLPVKDAHQQTLYHRTDRYTWKEFDPNGSRLLKESGYLNAIGIDFKTTINDKSSNETNLEVYTGDVNYEGQTWDGTALSASPHYRGFKTESIFYNKTGMENIDMLLGIGYNSWQRGLKDTPTVNGYEEKWAIAYTKVGMLQKKNNFSWELGLKYPLYSRNRVEEFDVTVKPDQQVSFYGELGLKLAKNVDLALTYDSMRFSASDPVYSTVLKQELLQPQSKADIWGLKLAGKL